MKYQVTVGNIGTVYEGNNYREAKRDYNTYVLQSKDNYGRASGESVTMWKHGEPMWEHIGELD